MSQSRRDIADSIRSIDCSTEPPTADEIKEFDDYMAGKEEASPST